MGKREKKISIHYEKGKVKVKRVEHIEQDYEHKVIEKQETITKDFEPSPAPDWVQEQIGCKKVVHTFSGYGFCLTPNDEIREIDFQKKTIDENPKTKESVVKTDLMGLAIPENEFYELTRQEQDQIKTTTSKEFWDQFLE